MGRERKHYAAEEKVAILRCHVLDKGPVSNLCEELGLQPTVFYRWQKEFFENGAAAVQSAERPRRQAEEKQKRIELLEKKLRTEDEVLAEQLARCLPQLSLRELRLSSAGNDRDEITAGHRDSKHLWKVGEIMICRRFQPVVRCCQRTSA